MARPVPLSRSRPLGRLLEQLRRLSEPDRHLVWSVYRACRRTARLGLEEKSVPQLAQSLRRRVAEGEAYWAVSLGLKLAQAYTLAALREAGADGRHPRAIAREGFHLVRLELREALGMREPGDTPSALFGPPPADATAQAWSDGGVRAGRAAAAYLVRATDGNRRIQAAAGLATTNALEAELEAAIRCLGAMLDAGIRQARLNVDALGVVRAFQGRLALKFCVQEARLLQLAERFRSLEVRLVPRAFNVDADRLATAHLAESTYNG